MKIVLVDGSEFSATIINRNYRPNDENTLDTIDVTLANNLNIEDVSIGITKDNCKKIIVKRDGFEDIVYEDYEFVGVMQSISSFNNSINVNFKKE